ncbi:MAG: dihydroorotase, partial [Clostridia bacterium]|nr:dihydroorotase [Clostridia bacterium]
AFSDDGKGVQSESMMRSLMEKVKKHSKILAAHCEDNSLLRGGYIHDGEYARLHGHKGICGESEWGQIKRDLELAKETGCAYHVCHISCKESVELIRNAKKEGADVTCETAPHYLLMNDMMLREDGKFKMNPPIRSESDREALINGLLDGTVDMIATDHAPHSKKEKSKGLAGSAFGIIGLETSFPLLYTELVKKNIINMEKLLDLMCYKPRKRFGIKTDTGFSFWALGDAYIIDPEDFLSKGRATPFEGRSVFGRCVMTVYDGKPVYGE